MLVTNLDPFQNQGKEREYEPQRDGLRPAMSVSTFLSWLLPGELRGRFWNVKEDLQIVSYEELHSKLWEIVEECSSETLSLLSLTGKNPFIVLWSLLSIVRVYVHHENSVSLYLQKPLPSACLGDNVRGLGTNWLTQWWYFGVFICLFAKELVNYSLEIWNFIHFRGFIINKPMNLKITVRQRILTYIF